MSIPIFYRSIRLLLLCAFVLLGARVSLALQPDEIALIVNSNVPEGRELAQHYAMVRGVPDNRILELDLPPGEEIGFDLYERTVVPQVREFLRAGGMDQKITCFVTFYGVPLRIADKINSPREKDELAGLQRDLPRLIGQLQPVTQEMEKLAGSLNSRFTPATGNDLDHLERRMVLAKETIIRAVFGESDLAKRAALLQQLLDVSQPALGRTVELQKLALEQQANRSASKPANRDLDEKLSTAMREYQKVSERAGELEQLRYDPRARQDLRNLVSNTFGLLGYCHLLRDQSDYLQTTDTHAAFDSELSLVRWMAYAHRRWIDNPLAYNLARPHGPMVMTMRLDAPKPEQVRKIIDTSVAVEKAGLNGKLVADSRGMRNDDGKSHEVGFVVYDESIRNLASLVKGQTHLEVLADNKPDVLPANSAKLVSLYVGWYSVRQYVPSCEFVPGAVGYHIASYELISLHGAGESGWVAGMINDGACATLGAVAEPFLQAFPHPDDFFPLLLTGKLTLADVYWRTTPMTSWQLCMIGDPLYTPYKNNPQLKVDQLPPRLANLMVALQSSTQPATLPTTSP